jgi:hypothetical protein
MGLVSFFVRLGLDASQFSSGLKTAQSTGQKFARDVKRDIGAALAGIFAVDKIVEYQKQVIQLSGKINDMSAKLGVSPEFIQDMAFAAQMGGTDIETMSAALEKLSISRSKALAGDTGLVDSFQKLGVTFEDLKRMRVEELLFRIGAAFEGGINPQPLLGALKEIAGKSAGALVPAMADGLGAAADNAKRMGLTLETDVVSALDELGDRMQILDKIAQSFIGRFTGIAGNFVLKRLEAAGAVFSTAFNLARDPMANPETSPTKRLGFFFDQLKQSYVSSLDEQEQERIDATASRRLRERMRSNLGLDEAASDPRLDAVAKKASRGLQMSQDPLARIGGFTAFGSAVDREMAMQTRILRNIERATVSTAASVRD